MRLVKLRRLIEAYAEAREQEYWEKDQGSLANALRAERQARKTKAELEAHLSWVEGKVAL